MTTHHHGDDHNHHQEGPAAGQACGGHAPAADTFAQTSAEDITECPVMVGTTVMKAQAEAAGLFRDHNGQRYWLCCNACGPLFDADPERYTAA